MALITITGTITDAEAVPATSGVLSFTLNEFMINTAGKIIPSKRQSDTLVAVDLGTFSIILESTTDATPSNRYYSVRFEGVIAGRRVYQNLGNISVPASPATANLSDLITAGIISGGSAPAIASLTISSTEPRLLFKETDAAADEKLWDFDLNAKTLTGRTRTDADGAGITWLSVLRGTGTAVTSITMPTLTISALTAGRVVFAGAGGLLADDADLTFLMDTLSATKVAMSSLTSGRVPLVSTLGLLVDSGNLTWASPALTIGLAASATGILKFKGTTSGVVSLSVADAAGTHTIKLPTADGSPGQLLKTDGSGQWSFVTVVSGVSSITGTANQVIRDVATGDVTLSLPQSIATTSTPQFLRLGLGAAANGTAGLSISQDRANYGTDDLGQIAVFGASDSNKRMIIGYNTTANASFIGSTQAGTTRTPIYLQPISSAGANVGIGAPSFGTNAASVFAIGNGTEPTTSPADGIQLYSVDLSAGNATLGLRTETAVAVDVIGASTHTLSVRINGTTYKILLST